MLGYIGEAKRADIILRFVEPWKCKTSYGYNLKRHAGQCSVMHYAWKRFLCMPSQESFTFPPRD